VLTVADSLATGSGSWGPWHEALVASLVSRLDAALDPARTPPGLAETAEAVRGAALGALEPDAGRRARAFVTHASLRYLAGRRSEDVVRDAALVATLDPNQPGDARLAVRMGALEGTRELSVAALDRPELMARLAGALSLGGLDILSADAYRAGEGVALDLFVVRSATLAPIEHDAWARVERYIRAALSDRLELETRLAERRRHYPAVRRDVRCQVVTDASAGVDTTVLVTAADRVGLLYDVVRAIASVELDIRWAKAVTADGIARDAFHVVGPEGQAPTDPGLLGHLAMRIRERV
jgi:[protein-PII] uridylyltransferase